MVRRSWWTLTVLAVLAAVGTTRAPAQFNPGGWVQTDGWNMMFPLLNPDGCGGGGEGKMRQNWVAPHDMGTEDPQAGDVWADIDFGGTAAAAGFDLGGLNADPIWVTNDFLELAFGLPAGSMPNGDVSDYQVIADFINANVVPAVPGATPLPTDNVVSLATTYVRNDTGAGLEVDFCTSSDDSVHVRVNNLVVTNVSACRGTAGGCSETRATVLPPGVSKITALVWEGGGGWGLRFGIRLAGVSSNLADGNGMVTFLGPVGEGQLQYSTERQAAIKPFNCPNDNVKVTILGNGPGAPGDLVTVIEGVDVATPANLSLTDVTMGGVVSDKFSATQPLRPVGPHFDDHYEVGAHAGPASTTTYDAGTQEYTSVSNSGGDLWDGSNDFEFAYNRMSGDFDISVKVVGRTHPTPAGNPAPNRWGKTGLMARMPQSTVGGQQEGCSKQTMIQDHYPDLEDAFRLAGRQTHNNCATMYEEVNDRGPGAVPSAHPPYYRLTRRGNVIEGWGSDNPAVEADPTNDANWSARGRADDWGSAPELLVGFASSEHSDGGAGPLIYVFKVLNLTGTRTTIYTSAPTGKQVTWTNVPRSAVTNGELMYNIRYSSAGVATVSGKVEDVSVTGGTSSINFAPQSGPVGAFATSHDIGGPATQGSTTFNGTTYTMTASGNDFWDGGDQGHFAYIPVTGDFDAIMHITSRTPPVAGGRWGKHGIMARNTCDQNSKHSIAETNVATPGDVIDEPRHHYRLNHLDNGSNRESNLVSDGFFTVEGRQPTWVRLMRAGNGVYSLMSEDNGAGQPKKWHMVGSDNDPNRPATLLVGAAATSHAGGNTMSFDFTFDLKIGAPQEMICNVTGPLVGTDLNLPDNTPLAALGGVGVSAGGFSPAILGNRLRINEDGIGSQANAVWFVLPGSEVLTRDGFDADYDVIMTKGAGGCDPAADPNPADGMTFAVMEVGGTGNPAGPFPTDLAIADLRGDGGGAEGYEGFRIRERTEGHASFAIEADNWVGGGEPANEPAGAGSPDNDCTYHVGLNANGSVSSMQTNVQLGVPTAALPYIFAPSGAHFKVRYERNGFIKVWVNGVDRAGNTVPPVQVINGRVPALSGPVLVGFTGGTGGATCRQEVDNIVLSGLHCVEALQIAGDCNQDGGRDIADILCYIYRRFPTFILVGDTVSGPGCSTAAGDNAILDVNGSGATDVADIVYLANSLFLGGPGPVQGASCFEMADGLGCSTSVSCE